MNDPGKRYVSIDFLKVFAIISVVLCHSVEMVYSTRPEYLETLPDMSNLFRISMHTIGRTFGVPLFLMISGFLLLDRCYDADRMKRFFTKNWLHLIVCTMIWFAIYDVYIKIYMQGDMNCMMMARDVLFLRKPRLGHQWYMPMIIGYYSMVPFVANALSRKDGIRMLWIPYLMVFVYASVVPFFNLLLTAYDRGPFSPQIDMGFTGGVFGLYMVGGFMIKKKMLRKVSPAVLLSITISSLAVLIAFCYYYYRSSYIVWYDNPFVIISSVTAFEYASRHTGWKQNDIVLFLAKYAFAVYLIHILIRNLSPVRQAVSMFDAPLRVIMLTAITLFVSYCLAWIIGRTKAGRYILYIK